MPERIMQAAKAVAPIIDAKTGLGAGVSVGGMLVSITEWAPVFGTIVSCSVGMATFVYLVKGIKLRDLEIEEKERKLEED